MAPQETSHDPLTGLLNREAFEARFTEILDQAKDQEAPASLAFIDIDFYKRINDNFGRAAGDGVLRTLSEIIKNNLVEGSLAVRYGGDEFAFLFPNTEREQAFLALERIRAAVEAQENYGEGEHRTNEKLTISGGIAAFPIDGTSEGELLRKADQALYRAKATSRNSIRLAHEERMAPKTAHFTLTQLERLSKLAKEQGVGEAVLLREALDDLIFKYGVNRIES